MFKAGLLHRRELLFTFLFFVLLVFCAYSSGINSVFLSDDIPSIAKDPAIQHPSYFLTNPLFVQPLIYFLIAKIFGLTPWAFRMVNILFHIGTVWMIYLIVRRMVNKIVALLAATLFAVHPLAVESVTWISGGNYSRSAFFFFLSLWLYMKTEKEKKWYWFSVAAFLLGLLSNVKIFTLPLMFLFYEWFYGSLKKRWKYLIPYFLSSFGIILLFISGVNTRITQVSAGQNQPIGYDNIFVTIPLAIGWYIKLIFWPQILTLYHSTLIYSRPEFFLYVGITICYFVALTVAFKKNKLIFFWLMLFILNIAFSLTPLRLSWTVAERYAYISYIGILVPSALGIAFLLKRYKKYEGLIWVSFFLTISILFIRTFVRNIDWQTQDNLWLATAEASPTSPTARNNMGLVYFKQGDYEGAIQEFQTSLKLNPNNANAWHNMGNAYRLLKQDEKAVECFQKALALDPKLWQSDEYIAAIYFEHQQYQEALPYLQKAMELRPDDTRLMFNAAALYFQMNQREQAKQEFEKILSIDPNNADAKEGLKEIDR